ncbi:MAG: S8 family serine peptidase [Bacteroidales bacterium]|nr:S8 family serine peptidase [Bacteroidales bacterium]
MKKIILSFALMAFFAVIAQAQDYYWVFFKNKAGSTFNPYEYFDAKAVERYRMNGVSLYDSTNFPLNGGYVSQVEGVCEDFVGESRWLNAVGVGATPEQIAAIAEMPFVSRILPIESNMQLASCEAEWGYRDTNLWSLGVTPQLRRMKGERFVAKGIDGTGIRIAVFDGGFPKVDVHPVFKHLRDNKRIIATWNFPKKKADVYGWNKHGTMVLSCIAGKNDTMQLGLATGAEFLLARTEVNTEPAKEEVWWAMAMEWADKNGADIISSSLGYGKERHYTKDMDGTSVVAKAANLAARKGMLVCNAAGNEGSDRWNTIITPADADSVIAVGGIEASLEKYNHISFSSYGPTADGRMKPNVCNFGHTLCATTSLGIDDSYGTSFATPLTSGFAACAWQCRKGYTAMQMKAEIERSADLYPYFDYAYGYGVPQATYFLGENTQPKPTIHFREDSNCVCVVSDISKKSANVFCNLQRPDGRLTQYCQYKRECRDSTGVVVIREKQRCAGYTVNISIEGYTASYTFKGAMQDTMLTENVFSLPGQKFVFPKNVALSRSQEDEPFGKDKRPEWDVFFQFGSVVNDGNSDLRNWLPAYTMGAAIVFPLSKVYKIGIGLDYHRRNYKPVKDICTNFDAAFGLPEEAMADVDSKRLIERGFDLELFQRVRFASSVGESGLDVHWDLGVYGSLNWQRYSLRMGSSGDYGKLSFGKLRYASLLDWGVTTRFTWTFWSIYGRYRLSGLNKTYDEPSKYFEELPRFEVGIEGRFNIDDFLH